MLELYGDSWESIVTVVNSNGIMQTLQELTFMKEFTIQLAKNSCGSSLEHTLSSWS